MNSEKIRRIAVFLFTPVVMCCVGIALLAGAFLLPLNPIRHHVQKSSHQLVQETDYFSVTPSDRMSRLDNYSDAVYLNQALVGVDSLSLRECVLKGYVYSVPDSVWLGETWGLAQVLDPDTPVEIIDARGRFFNGYMAVVKAFLVVTDYSGIREFNILAEILLLFLLCYFMQKRRLGGYILPVVLALLMLRPISMACCMAYAGFYYCSVIPSIIILAAHEKLKKGIWYILFFELIGCWTFYFNMNYFQLITYCLPLVFVLLLDGIPEKASSVFWKGAVLFFAWCFGYYGMMLAKWVAAFLILHQSDLFSAMISQALMRTSTGVSSEQITRLSAMSINFLKAFSDLWWDLAELAFVVCMLVIIGKRKAWNKLSGGMILFFVAMLLLPLVRYLIFANHVYVHYEVMHRLMMIPILALNVLLVYIVTDNRHEKIPENSAS